MGQPNDAAMRTGLFNKGSDTGVGTATKPKRTSAVFIESVPHVCLGTVLPSVMGPRHPLISPSTAAESVSPDRLLDNTIAAAPSSVLSSVQYQVDGSEAGAPLILLNCLKRLSRAVNEMAGTPAPSTKARRPR